MLHHVCGEHEWAGGKCEHQDPGESSEPKTNLKKDSAVMEALRKIVLDPKFMKSLQYYVRFR